MVRKKKWVAWKKSLINLTNTRKEYHLKLNAAAFREVENVPMFAKALIEAVMALNLNGQREERQLFRHLRKIVAKYTENVLSTSVADSLKLDGDVKRSAERRLGHQFVEFID